MKVARKIITLAAVVLLLAGTLAWAAGDRLQAEIYPAKKRKPVDSRLKVKVGEMAPDFTLPAVSGRKVTLSAFRGHKNVALSFVPAAWTLVCSDQWPGYNIARELFEENDAVLLGISVDNIPTLYAWIRAMGGLWFEVLSDFWPHGDVADRYGVLRSDGTAERALFVLDKKGIIRFLLVSDINRRPDLQWLAEALEKVNTP